MLNKYPNIIMLKVTIPKNIKSNFNFIIFFNIKASGKESPTVDIIKAKAVPRGTPLAIKA